MILLFVSRRGCIERVYNFFALCFCAIPFPAAYGAEEIATLDAVPTLVFRMGAHLSQLGVSTRGGCESSALGQARLGADGPRGTAKGAACCCSSRRTD